LNYMPAITAAEPVAQYSVAGLNAVLLDNIRSAGAIGYRFILVVYAATGEPCLFVASEVNAMAAELGGGSHFLGVFPGDSHENHGSSDDWANRDLFVKSALAIAEERLTPRSVP